MGLGELTRNAVDVLPKGELERKLALGRPLRVKLGIDVTSPDIHVGRAIPLQRMRAFQNEGHTGVLIIGDYTTRIGDPSGRSTERPVLSDEEIDRNAKTYMEQAMIILDPDRTEVRFNGEWLSKLSYAEVVRLARTMPRTSTPRCSKNRLSSIATIACFITGAISAEGMILRLSEPTSRASTRSPVES